MPYHTKKKGMKEGGCGCGCQAKTTSNHPDPLPKKEKKHDHPKIVMKKPKDQKLNPY